MYPICPSLLHFPTITPNISGIYIQFKSLIYGELLFYFKKTVKAALVNIFFP